MSRLVKRPRTSDTSEENENSTSPSNNNGHAANPIATIPRMDDVDRTNTGNKLCMPNKLTNVPRIRPTRNQRLPTHLHSTQGEKMATKSNQK